MKGLVADANIQGHVEYLVQRMQADGDFSLIPTGFRRNPLSYRRLAMILASISGGQSLGKPLPDLSRQGQSLCEEPFSVSCRKSKPFKPSDAVGFDEKSQKKSESGIVVPIFESIALLLSIMKPRSRNRELEVGIMVELTVLG